MAEPLMEAESAALESERAARLARLIRKQMGFVWRLLRCTGASEVEAESAVQEVFAAASQRIGDIRAGSERSFLFSTTLHVAARVRKNRGDEPAAISDHAPALEDLDEQGQARAMLGALLEQMPLELRVVFVLHEIEQLASLEIAAVVGIPLETVAARLAEAQEDYATHLDSESELAVSLIGAARAEQAPEGALARALANAGVSPAVVAADAEASSARGPLSTRSAALAAARSPFSLAAKWLVVGWIVGLVAAFAVYAMSGGKAPASPPAAH